MARKKVPQKAGWQNGPLVLYHGTDSVSAKALSHPTQNLPHNIDLAQSHPRRDFGRGFYTTSRFDQAMNWANQRFEKSRARSGRKPRGNKACVAQFSVDRNHLARLDTLCFVLADVNPDVWEFVLHCRGEGEAHCFWGSLFYDVVFGPVVVWPQRLWMKDCDQVSFHTEAALAILPKPTLIDPPRGDELFQL